MELSHQQLTELCEKAKQAATSAGLLIESYRDKNILVENKSEKLNAASNIVTEVDKKSEELIISSLRSSTDKYNFAVLGEEQEDNKQRLHKDYFWCIDPLDGTLPFTQSKPGYSVAISLVSKSGIPQLGVIYDPSCQKLYSAIVSKGAFINGKRIDTHLQQRTQFVLPVDHSFASRSNYPLFINECEKWAVSNGFEGLRIITDLGAVLCACTVLQNKASCYFKIPKPNIGGGSIWDVAATICLLNEVGAISTDYHGRKIQLNNPNTTYLNNCGLFFTQEKYIYDAITAIANKIFKPSFK